MKENVGEPKAMLPYRNAASEIIKCAKKQIPVSMKSDPNNPKSISAKARSRRMQLFVQTLQQCDIVNSSILDLGGTIDYWKMHLRFVPQGLIRSIDVVNLPPVADSTQVISNVVMHSYAGDALEKSSLKQTTYDVVYSNSVIEHVGNLRSQHKMANTIRAMGNYHWIQTPAKSFPLEPHFYFPFFPYLPLWLRTRLLQHLHLGFMGRNPVWLEARMICEETRLMTKAEIKAIFPDSGIIQERMLLFCKSYIATNMMTLKRGQSRMALKECL